MEGMNIIFNKILFQRLAPTWIRTLYMSGLGIFIIKVLKPDLTKSFLSNCSSRKYLKFVKSPADLRCVIKRPKVA